MFKVGKKVFGKFVKSIGTRAGVKNGQTAVRRGILDARNPGARGSSFGKKTVQTDPANKGKRFGNWRSNSMLGLTGLGAVGGVGAGLKTNNTKTEGDINVYVVKKRTKVVAR